MSYNTNAVELRQKRAQLVADARKLLERAKQEKRELTPEEQATWDTMMADVDGLKTRIDALEKFVGMEEQVADAEAEMDPPEQVSRKPRDLARLRSAPGDGASEAVQLQAAWGQYIRRGVMSPAMTRALSADHNDEGGFLILPQEMSAKFIQAVDDSLLIRQLATVEKVTAAQSLGVPSLDADPADAEWTSEILTGGEDSTMKFGKRELHPKPLAKRIKVSKKLLRLHPNAESRVIERLSYKFAVAEEKGFLTGAGGPGTPLGVFVASTDGISTTRDVTAASATAVVGDDLINLKYQLKEQYMRSPSLRIVAHRDLMKMVRKLKDGNSQYLWQPGIAGDEDDTVLNIKVLMSEYAPNTFTTGKYVAVVGDFSFYHIAEVDAVEFQRLEELYAETNQVGFIGRMEVDGMPVLQEAFARLKLA